MRIYRNHSLKKYNTFGIDVKTKYFVEVKNIKQIRKILQTHPNEKILLLGEGSNTLLVNNWEGVTIKDSLKGKEIKKNGLNVEIKIASGENWNEFVKYTVKKNLSGIENLTMIPGTVGGAVAQNIGAYGTEIIDTVTSIEAVDIKTLKLKTLSPKECGFGYRNTFFKNKWREKYIITAATFLLKQYPEGEKGDIQYQKDFEKKKQYQGIKEELEKLTTEPYSIKKIMDAIDRLRKRKLPSLEEYGTCGCFFENPIVSLEKYDELSKKIKELPQYPWKANLVKIPAGKLVEELNWKGKWEGEVGISAKHALCVVTNRNASGKEVYDFVQKIKDDVGKEYGVVLREEVNIIKK